MLQVNWKDNTFSLNIKKLHKLNSFFVYLKLATPKDTNNRGVREGYLPVWININPDFHHTNKNMAVYVHASHCTPGIIGASDTQAALRLFQAKIQCFTKCKRFCSMMRNKNLMQGILYSLSKYLSST